MSYRIVVVYRVVVWSCDGVVVWWCGDGIVVLRWYDGVMVRW